MSLRRIPDKFLNTDLSIIKDVATLDDVGDARTIKELAYASIKANVQAGSRMGRREEIEYELHGKLYKQTHVAYFNRFDGEKIKIEPGYYAVDLETMKHYLILSVLDYQSARRSIDDSHHLKLILRTTDGEFRLKKQNLISSKAKIV